MEREHKGMNLSFLKVSQFYFLWLDFFFKLVVFVPWASMECGTKRHEYMRLAVETKISIPLKTSPKRYCLGEWPLGA